jgi:hypothetical protein
MRQTGLINIIRTTGDAERSGGSVLGALVGLAGVVLLAAWGYRALDVGLRGLAETTAGWVLLARMRTVRDAPVVDAFTAATDRALEAHRHRQLTASPGAERSELHHVSAVRLDRLDTDQRQP